MTALSDPPGTEGWTGMDEERLARMEVLLEGGTKDLALTRTAMEKAVENLDRRLAMVELSVRALEDKQLRDKTIAAERERIAEATAERVLDERHRHISRVDLYVTAVLIGVATIAATLVAHFLL